MDCDVRRLVDGAEFVQGRAYCGGIRWVALPRTVDGNHDAFGFVRAKGLNKAPYAIRSVEDDEKYGCSRHT